MQAAWFVWAAVIAQLVAATLANHVMRPGPPPTLASMAEAAGLPAITVMLFVVCVARMYVRARHEPQDLNDAAGNEPEATVP
jgi:cation transporter-like permease